MYQHLTKEDWIKLLNLPNGYTVDAFLVAGAGKRDNDEAVFYNIVSELKLEEPPKHIEKDFFKNVVEFKLNGKRIWYDITYGGAYLSELANIACILGSKKNILLGSCGGLQTNLSAGDIIIPTYTYGNESATRMYQRDVTDNKHYPDEKLSKEIESSIDKKYTTYRGPVVTCQAMLGETKEDVDNWQKESYLAVEMESSTLFAVSNHYNVPSTAILHISDNLVKNELVGSDEYLASKAYRYELREYKYKIAFKELLKL
jgi:hypothetical protein